MDWLQFIMALDSLDPAAVEDALLEAGACSVTLSDAGNDPVLEPGPGETPLWARTRITGLFPGDTEPRAIRAQLLDLLDVDTLPAHHVEVLEDREWEREWLRDFGPMRFGERLWVCPNGMQVEADDAVVVHLDPGLAFGTGTHPTTAMCLEWLDSANLAGRSVLDYGCGSGVLAIAALKLGAGAATGMDIDPQATIATRQNAAANGVSVTVCGGDDEIVGTYDVVVANILAGPLVEIADCITSRLASRGMLALSGVLCEQAEEVMSAYAPWIAFDEPLFREQDGQTWTRLTGSRR
jgi:ribosomal protein L11 methyltransferase